MSKQTAWLELFAGVVIDDPDTEERRGTLQESVDSASNAQAVYDRKRQEQAEALAQVRAKFDRIKADVQKVLSAKIESGPFKGKSFLDVKGGQIKEIDVEDVSSKAQKLDVPPIPKDITAKLLSEGYKIGDLGRELREKRFVPILGGKEDEPLFTNAELQAEFWTPVNRERIFPEGFIGNPWSATQRMLDETNALYLEMVEQKKLAGELTPERDFLKDSLETGGKLLSIAASSLGGFKGEDLTLAKDILESSSEVLGSLAEVREKLKNSEFTDAASIAFDIAAAITSSVLTAANVDESTVKAASEALNAGGSAVLLGKTLNQVRSGEANLSEALMQMGDVLGKALATASQGTDNEAAKAGLDIAAKAAPSLFKALGLGTDLPELVRNGDVKGVIDRFADLTKDVLEQLPGLDNLGIDLGSVIDMGASALKISIDTAFAVKKGEYLKALNGVIGGVGDVLGKVLETAGVDSGLSDQIVKLYTGAASAPKALELMRQNPPKATEAINALVGGVESALGGTGNNVLAEVGKNLALGVKTLITADQLLKLYKEEKYDEAVNLFSTTLTGGFKSLSGSLGITVEDDTGTDDSTPGSEGGGSGTKPSGRVEGQRPVPNDKAVADLKKLVGDLKTAKVDPEAVEKAAAILKKTREEEQAAADLLEAEELLAEAELDLKALTEAERTGSEASNIDRMIGDLLRDRMIYKLATQIAQGGAAFLAQFLPGLGAASAGIKLAASLVAAGQRAQQLDQWLSTKGDLEKAQSELSSSAANFVKNQGQQLAHYSAQAFFAAAQLAGEIAKLTPGAAVGAILSASAAASAKAEDLVMDMKNKYDVEAGWKATQKALRNPGNRRLGLEARKLNPTLAKYSMAWGAVVLKDPLARGAMKACGLTEASLKNENADTHKVVKYLETFYEDDVSIYRDATVNAPDWVPAEIEISLTCWAAFRRGAQSISKTKSEALAIGNAAMVEGLFGEFEGAQEEADKTSEVLDSEQAKFSFAGAQLRAAAQGGTDQGKDLIPVLPDSTALQSAIADHSASLRKRSDVAQRLYYALLESNPVAEDQEKSKAILKDAMSAMQVFRARADRVFKAAKIDADGLDEAKTELQRTMTTMQRQIDDAKEKKLKSGTPESEGSTSNPKQQNRESSKKTEAMNN